MDKRPNASVRGINPELFKDVKVNAAWLGISLVQWWEDAARLKLNIGGKKSTH